MSNQWGLFVKTAFVLSLFVQGQYALADESAKKSTPSTVEKETVNQEDIKDAVVKIIVVSHVIDKKEPWNSSIERSSGSGFIIDGDRILTNAHVVSNATFIEVQKQAETKRYEAKTVSISHEADLAIITLKEKSATFFKTKKLTFGGLPELQKEVSTFGYPTGGSGLSVTKGVVSRIERSSYVHKGKSFISVQIDAAINPGNSGGPVLSNGKVVGVVMQSRTLSQSIGYMIPVPVISHFLDDIEDGDYDGYPSLGIDVEKIESPAIRDLYGLKDEQSGVLVTLVYPGTPSTEVLRKNDIITTIDGHSISNNAKTELRHKELINFNHYVDMHQLGDEIKLTIIREGKAQDVTVKLSETDDALRLVGAKQFERPPSYFVYGGFVFMPLTSDYISASNGRYSSGLDENITVLKQFWPTKERTQAVILTNVLPDDSNKGFHNIGNMLVDKLNGEKFKDFNVFYNMLMKGDSEFVVLEDQFGFQVAINRKLAIEKQDKILERYSIASGESKDLKAL
ncbi:MAG: serine protease, partial [Thiotrichaceae bacterium]